MNQVLIKYKYWFLVLFFVLATLTRFAFLKTTATFFWDQAYDLRQIQLFYTEKRVTLIGPISEEGDKVFSSLTYYMLLPFAVHADFSTVSTTFGAAFWGLITAILLVVLLFLVNKHSLISALLIVAIWFPLVETSRWAWNPHLVLFWIALGLIIFQRKGKLPRFLTGLFFGLSIHHHYLSFFATATFILINLFIDCKKKNLKKSMWMIIGYLAAISPFVIFDIMRPPGLFISRFLIFQQEHVDTNILMYFLNFLKNLYLVINHYTNSLILNILLGIYLAVLIVSDFKKERSHLQYIAVWLLQIAGVTLIVNPSTRYFLPSIIFFLVYLYLPRNIPRFNSVIVSTVLILTGSIFSIVPQITTQNYVPEEWRPGITTVDQITEIVFEEITENNLTEVNLAVLGSPDPNRYGWKYRNLLEIKGVTILSKFEYFTNNYLFVVSQQTEDSLRNDPSPEMHRFREQKLVRSWPVENSDWFVYLFSF